MAIKETDLGACRTTTGTTMMIVHKAAKINADGGVSLLCADEPRAINLKRVTWTNRNEAVTCPQCLARIDDTTVPRRPAL